MSDVERWGVQMNPYFENKRAEMEVKPNGDFVSYEDYARLKAEVVVMTKALAQDATMKESYSQLGKDYYEISRRFCEKCNDYNKLIREVAERIEELNAQNDRLKAEVERLQSLFTKVESCRYDITSCKLHPEDSWGIPSDWRAEMFNLHLKRLKVVIEEAKEVQS